MLTQSGIDPSEALKYELDHYVPLALGGHPRSLDNLWLQRWDGEWNARIKDRLERTLQVMVCAGQISLQDARTSLQGGWKDAYKKLVGSKPEPRDMEIKKKEVGRSTHKQMPATCPNRTNFVMSGVPSFRGVVSSVCACRSIVFVRK